MFFKLPPTYFFSFFAKIFDFLLIHLFSKGVKFSLEKNQSKIAIRTSLKEICDKQQKHRQMQKNVRQLGTYIKYFFQGICIQSNIRRLGVPH